LVFRDFYLQRELKTIQYSLDLFYSPEFSELKMKKGLTEKELHTCAMQKEARSQRMIHQLFSNSCTTLKDL